jgi:hypothetical protein
LALGYSSDSIPNRCPPNAAISHVVRLAIPFTHEKAKYLVDQRIRFLNKRTLSCRRGIRRFKSLRNAQQCP